MRAYRVVQTGAKMLFGGLHVGFFKLAYQGSRFFTTNTAPDAPEMTVPPICSARKSESENNILHCVCVVEFVCG